MIKVCHVIQIPVDIRSLPLLIDSLLIHSTGENGVRLICFHIHVPLSFFIRFKDLGQTEKTLSCNWILYLDSAPAGGTYKCHRRCTFLMIMSLKICLAKILDLILP